jgi:acyl-homoserine lactone acylase PvdQ
MMKFIKIGGFFILGITLLIFIAIGITWLKASSSVPDYDGQVSSSKVSANIDLIRDEHGVVHIEAKKSS